MGLRLRKSIQICKGVRLNFGKTGASVSFGTRGLRHTIHSSGRRTSSVGIPGTGISYVSTSKAKRKYKNPAYSKREELQRQKEEAKADQVKENALLVEEYNNLLEIIKGIHRECDDVVDWHHIYSLEEPFNPDSIGPKQAKAIDELNNYEPGFFERLFNKEKKRLELEKAVEIAAQEDAEDYKEWRDLHLLSERILAGDIDAYLEVINEMEPFDDLLEFGSDFEIGTEDPSMIEVEFRVKSDTVVPKYSLSLTKTGKLSQKALTKTAYYDLVQDYVCSCAIRIARDIFALLPVDKVLVHAVDDLLNTQTGHYEAITILSVLFEKEVLNNLNFELIDPSDALNNFEHRMKFLKTAGFKPVARIDLSR